MNAHSIRIIYLGKKGGGLSLLEDILTHLNFQDRSYEIWLSSTLNSKDLDLSGSHGVIQLFSPRNFTELLNPKLLFGGIINLIKVFSPTKANISIFLMPSPFDWIYYRILRANKQIVVTCIHDLKSHAGEKWPTLNSTLFRLKMSDIVVAFSQHIALELRTKTSSEILVAGLPRKLQVAGSLGSDIKSLIQIMKSHELPIVLLIGRQRKYKDSEAFLNLAHEFQSSALFVIAGEGLIRDTGKSKTIVINRWLSNIEFMEIIANANIVFFPYSEASQSGNIPIVMAEKKIVVATSQTGLVEQLSSYPLKVIYDGGKSGEISLALANALAIHAASDKYNVGNPSDHLIPLPEVIDAIEHKLNTRRRID
jgi:hypothetical protein